MTKPIEEAANLSATAESETTRPRPESSSPLSLARRSFLGTGLASLLGLVIGKMGGSSPAAAQAPAHKTFMPLVSGSGTLCLQSLTLLPTTAAVDFWQKRLREDPGFRLFYDTYTAQGFEFIPERVHLFMGVHNGAGGAGGTTAPSPWPFLLAIVPSFRSFEPTSPSHEAVSIVVLRERRVNTVLACQVEVGHRPFQINTFTVTELRPGGDLQSQRLDRRLLQSLTAEEVAERVGRPVVEADQWDAEVGGLSAAEISLVAALAFETLINDNYAAPLYPPGAIQSLLADTALVQKWAQAMSIRYAVALSGPKWCCSTSTSCNACSSTSTSSISLTLQTEN